MSRSVIFKRIHLSNNHKDVSEWRILNVTQPINKNEELYQTRFESELPQL